jgi:hypothetical protein
LGDTNDERLSTIENEENSQPKENEEKRERRVTFSRRPKNEPFV